MFQGKPTAGWGECPNQAYRTELRALNEDGSLCNTEIKVSWKDKGVDIHRINSGDAVYLVNGNYLAETTVGATHVSRSFAVSDEPQTIVLTAATADGRISGVVKSADDGSVIENAEIKVYMGEVLCGSAKTAADGSYQISLAKGNYQYVIAADGYISVSGYFSIEDGETKYMEAQMMAKNNNDEIMGGIFGTIKDARTGQPISDVLVEVYRGVNNTTESAGAMFQSRKTNAEGKYSYKTWSLFGVTFGLPAGNYTVVLSKEGYIRTSFNVVITGGTNTEFNGSIAPATAEDEYRVVLTWGAEPRDLDSHFIGKTKDGTVDHVFYSHMDGICANLDTDDTTSYGPETVYITSFKELADGFYYCVHDYTNRNRTSSTELANSGAMVQLYRGENLLATYYVPSGQEGTVWNVFSISSNGTIKPINTMSYESSPSAVGREFVSQSLHTMKSNDRLKDYESVAVEP